MKEASGELNLTVVTIIAIAAVATIAAALWPMVQGSINKQWNTIDNDNQNKYIKTPGTPGTPG